MAMYVIKNNFCLFSEFAVQCHFKQLLRQNCAFRCIREFRFTDMLEHLFNADQPNIKACKPFHNVLQVMQRHIISVLQLLICMTHHSPGRSSSMRPRTPWPCNSTIWFQHHHYHHLKLIISSFSVIIDSNLHYCTIDYIYSISIRMYVSFVLYLGGQYLFICENLQFQDLTFTNTFFPMSLQFFERGFKLHGIFAVQNTRVVQWTTVYSRIFE